MATSSREGPGELVRALGPLAAMSVIVGTVIGAGIFKKPQDVASSVPFFGLVALVWAIGGLLAALGSLIYAEIAVRYPRSGGNYVFLREAYGPLAGFLYGWVEFWIIRSASIAALGIVLVESLVGILSTPFLRFIPLNSVMAGFWSQRLIAVGVILALAAVNIVGVRWSGALQLWVTAIKVGTVVALALLPFVVCLLGAGAKETVRSENFWPLWPDAGQLSAAKIGVALVGVLWAYHGWMNAAFVAEEIKRPKRNLPIALLGGAALVVVLYLAANAAYGLVLSQHEISRLKETTVAAEFSKRLLGPMGGAVAAAAVLCSVLGAINGNLLGGSRLVFAMGRDRVAPTKLSAVHPRFHTPAYAIIALAAWSGLLVFGAAALSRRPLPWLYIGRYNLDLNVPPGKAAFDILTTYAMFGAVAFETLAVATIFTFRRRAAAPAEYHCPAFPLLPIVYVLAMSVVLINMFVQQRTEAAVGLAFIALGAAAYGIGIRRSPHAAAAYAEKTAPVTVPAEGDD